MDRRWDAKDVETVSDKIPRKLLPEGWLRCRVPYSETMLQILSKSVLFLAEPASNRKKLPVEASLYKVLSPTKREEIN